MLVEVFAAAATSENADIPLVGLHSYSSRFVSLIGNRYGYRARSEFTVRKVCREIVSDRRGVFLKIILNRVIFIAYYLTLVDIARYILLIKCRI